MNQARVMTNLEQGFIVVMVLLIAGIALNAGTAVANIEREGYWLAAINVSCCVLCVVCFIINWRRMAWLRREERKWRAAEATVRREIEGMLLSYPVEFTGDYPVEFMGGVRNQERVFAGLMRNPQRELDYCFEKCICPDCTNNSLHQATMRCMHPACGSQFHRDADGKWSRA